MHRMIFSRRIVFAILIIGASLLFVSSNFSFAQDQQDPASGLQISPTRTELTVKKGSTETVSITLKNVTGGSVIAKPQINDFESDNDTGTPRLLTDSDKKSAYTIKDFVSTIPDTPMSAGETKTIKIPVTVPGDQPPGGYFGVIRFIAEPVSASADQTGRQINLTASVGHIVLVNVPGNIKEQLQIVSFSAEKDNKQSSIFSSAPSSLALGLKNTGNSFSKPFGTVSIKDFKGKEVYKYEVNNTDPRGNVLPGSTRVFHDKLQDIGSSLGRYKAQASVSYGAGGDVLVSETYFWVIPMWARILAAVIILLILALIFYIYRRLRKHEKRYKR